MLSSSLGASVLCMLVMCVKVEMTSDIGDIMWRLLLVLCYCVRTDSELPLIGTETLSVGYSVSVTVCIVLKSVVLLFGRVMVVT